MNLSYNFLKINLGHKHGLLWVHTQEFEFKALDGTLGYDGWIKREENFGEEFKFLCASVKQLIKHLKKWRFQAG